MVHSIRKRASPSGLPLAVVWRRIETLRPDPANPRSHSPKQIRQLTRSIGAFGFNVPILVDQTLRIIAGHGRLLAAQELGWREVPTILLDHLSEAEAHAFMIADNRVAESAVWNSTLLIEQLKELSFSSDFVIETTGFEASDIELLTGGADRREPRRVVAARPASRRLRQPRRRRRCDADERGGCGCRARRQPGDGRHDYPPLAITDRRQCQAYGERPRLRGRRRRSVRCRM